MKFYQKLANATPIVISQSHQSRRAKFENYVSGVACSCGVVSSLHYKETSCRIKN